MPPMTALIALFAIAPRRCRLCGAVLAHDRPFTADTCTAHGADRAYSPRCDGQLADRVLALLVAAPRSKPVNVARMLGTEDHRAIWEAVVRLRDQGWPIVGVRGFGYLLSSTWRPRQRARRP